MKKYSHNQIITGTAHLRLRSFFISVAAPFKNKPLIVRTATKFVDKLLKTLTTASPSFSLPEGERGRGRERQRESWLFVTSSYSPFRFSRTLYLPVSSNLHSNFNQRYRKLQYMRSCAGTRASLAYVPRIDYTHRWTGWYISYNPDGKVRRSLAQSSPPCNYFPLMARHVNSNCSRIT